MTFTHTMYCGIFLPTTCKKNNFNMQQDNMYVNIFFIPMYMQYKYVDLQHDDINTHGYLLS